MRILGIDPGTATTGYGIIEFNGQEKFSLVDFGLISTSKTLPHGKRLDLIYESISSVITDSQPDVISIERLFFATNALTAIAVGQAIGVIKLAVHRSGIPSFDYTPMQVKLYVGGAGKADKKIMKTKVWQMLHSRRKYFMEIRDGSPFKISARTHLDNAADALALAICHARKFNPLAA